MKPERLVFATDLNDRLHVRIYVSGEFGKKERKRLIEQLKMQRKWLLEDQRNADTASPIKTEPLLKTDEEVATLARSMAADRGITLTDEAVAVTVETHRKLFRGAENEERDRT